MEGGKGKYELVYPQINTSLAGFAMVFSFGYIANSKMCTDKPPQLIHIQVWNQVHTNSLRIKNSLGISK